MKIILLDLGGGLALAVQMLFAIAFLLLPIAVGIYLLLIRATIGNLLSALATIALTIILAAVVLYVVSVNKGAEPFESLFDRELIQLSLIVSSFSILLIMLLAFLRFRKGN